MNHLLSRDHLRKVRTYDDFIDLSLSLGSIKKSDIFDFLFSIAISRREDPEDIAPGIAGGLLVELEPKHTRSCEELLNEIAKSGWDVSLKEVPFYLITQFGKWSLIGTYNAYISQASLNDEQRRRVQTVVYWTAGSSANLIRALHDWPWREDEGEMA
jgi:hypothetical protein